MCRFLGRMGLDFKLQLVWTWGLIECVCVCVGDRCLEEARLAKFTVEGCRLCKRMEEHTQTYVPTSHTLPSLHHTETQAYNSRAPLLMSSWCL